MVASGIERSLITGFDEASTAGSVTMPNELVAEIAERHPGRFIPFCGVDIFKGMDAIREMEHWIRDREFAGLSLRPFMIDLPADDRHYYPFYAKCVELGVPLSIHTSANWTTGRVNELGHPRHLDTVATHFPELVIVMSHAGYPWVLDACLLAWKHENVYLELAAHRPKYMARTGTGWEPLLRYGATTIRHKVLYGSGWFLMGRPPAEVPEQPNSEVWEAAPINEEQRRNLVGLIPMNQRPRVVLRWGDARDLLVSGLLDGGDEIAQHAAVIDSPLERGHVILFSLNPFWRGQTAGSYSLVFNTILNFDNLNVGRKLDEK